MIWNGFLFTIGGFIALIVLFFVWTAIDMLVDSIGELYEKLDYKKRKEAYDQKYGHIKHMEL